MTKCERAYEETLAALQQTAGAYKEAKKAHSEAWRALKLDRVKRAKVKRDD